MKNLSPTTFPTSRPHATMFNTFLPSETFITRDVMKQWNVCATLKYLRNILTHHPGLSGVAGIALRNFANRFPLPRVASMRVSS